VATTKPKSHTPEPSPDQKRPEVHIVRKGDTLYALAKRFDCSVEELQKANNLKSTALSIGQKLRIPDGELADNAPRPGIRTVRPVS
jgi:LysM repeat protein